jgi:hypothetical protein
MQYKPFPSEKRTYILQKPKEFEQFFQEISLAERNNLMNRLHYRTVFLSPYETIISEVASSYILC